MKKRGEGKEWYDSALHIESILLNGGDCGGKPLLIVVGDHSMFLTTLLYREKSQF